MKVHLVDGTYELFRQYYGAPEAKTQDGQDVGATRALLRTLLGLIDMEGATHLACAFDHVIESFRNDLFDGYKTGEGIEPELKSQFPLAEKAAAALGVVVWPMVEFEADDAIATAAARFADEVDQVLICSPDKDFAQCVRSNRVVIRDRRREKTLDAEGVREKFGVEPASIPDWLGLVGDSSDGIPGVPRWGAKSAATLLSHYKHIEEIPAEPESWEVKVRGAKGLAQSLAERREDALLYRKLAVLRTDVPLEEDLEALRWRGADRQALAAVCKEIEDERFPQRIKQWR